MFQRLFARIPVLAIAIGLCVAVSGCGGSKVTKANADKINTGMTEKEVTDILGVPTQTAEIDMPDIGGMLGGMAGGAIPGMPKMAKKAKQSTWKDGDKLIAITFVDGKVATKSATGF